MSFTSCLGLTGKTLLPALLPGLLPVFMELEVVMTGAGRTLMCEVKFFEVMFVCVDMIGDTGWDGMLDAVRLEEFEC